MNLRTYLNSLTVGEQQEFGLRCGTTIGYLRNALANNKVFRAKLAVKIELESGGAVPVEETLPDVEWAAFFARRSKQRAEQ